MKEIKFAQNIRELRKIRKWTQKELSELVGVDERTISAWERGINEPHFKTLAKLCEIFNETFDGILT